ncbi:MAG: FkbM family methyltransferase [Pseudomonadota bacterium]
MGLRRRWRRFKTDLGHGLRARGIRVPDALLMKDEPFVRKVAGTLSSDDVVIDLGAHLGVASIEFAHEAAKVYAFEPHPEIFQRLQRAVAKYPKIEPVNAAVSDENGTAQLFFERPESGKIFDGSTLQTGKSNVSYENAFDVKTVRLADFVEGLGREVRLIKMDIEGAEYRVLADLIESPAIHKIGTVYVEDHCDRIPGLAEERAKVEARIAELGLQNRFDFTWP